MNQTEVAIMAMHQERGRLLREYLNEGRALRALEGQARGGAVLSGDRVRLSLRALAPRLQNARRLLAIGMTATSAPCVRAN